MSSGRLLGKCCLQSFAGVLPPCGAPRLGWLNGPVDHLADLSSVAHERGELILTRLRQIEKLIYARIEREAVFCGSAGETAVDFELVGPSIADITVPVIGRLYDR